MNPPPIDCAFCADASWYGTDHMSSCPQALVKRLDEKLTRYRRFIQRLPKVHPVTRSDVHQFLQGERSK